MTHPNSIRLSLLKWLIVPLLFIQMAGAGITYWLAWRPAQTAFDQSLADAAWALIPRVQQLRGGLRLDLPEQAEQILRVDHFDAIYFVVRDAAGQQVAGDPDFPPLATPERFDDPIPYNGMMRSEEVRIISLKTTIGNEAVFIGVAETLGKRTRIRSTILMSLAAVEGGLTILAIALVWMAVGRGLLPLKSMQDNLENRDRDNLSPLNSRSVPRELRPLVGALNGLLGKIEAGILARQNFLADVAHQLRTPLAEVRMQLESMQHRQASPDEVAHAARLMTLSTERMIRQTNQFLALARAEPSQFEKTRLEAMYLNKVVEESIQHFIGEADKKHIDLGFELDPVQIMGDRFLLRDLIDNLIDNAIRYSAERGTVTVRCFHDGEGAVLSVEDSGPGIPPDQQELIFNRFYRIDEKIPGTGLGLAIVMDIVKDHGARIALTPRADERGTVFSVYFPATAQPAAAAPGPARVPERAA